MEVNGAKNVGKWHLGIEKGGGEFKAGVAPRRHANPSSSQAIGCWIEIGLRAVEQKADTAGEKTRTAATAFEEFEKSAMKIVEEWPAFHPTISLEMSGEDWSSTGTSKPCLVLPVVDSLCPPLAPPPPPPALLFSLVLCVYLPFFPLFCSSSSPSFLHALSF